MEKVNPSNEQLTGAEVTSSVAMVVTIISFSMLFATLMMGFALYRFTAPIWPPAGMSKPSLWLPSISTLFIFLSSFFYNSFEKNSKNSKSLWATIGLGCLFMLTQFLFWNQLKSQGIYASSGIFASIIYAFTWIHAAHIIAALILLVWLATELKKSTVKNRQLKILNVGKFWHFLGLIWLIMFVTIFVL